MIENKSKIQLVDFCPDALRDIGLVIADHDKIFDNKKGVSSSLAPHRHTFFEILYYTGGEGTHFIDFVPYRLKPPVFFFISPGQVHFWKVDKPLEGKLILFTENFLVLNPPPVQATVDDLHFLNHFMEKPELRVNIASKPFFDDKIKELEHELSIRLPGRTSLLRASLHILLIQLFRSYMSDPTEHVNENETSRSKY